jgi:hypothetical protein
MGLHPIKTITATAIEPSAPRVDLRFPSPAVTSRVHPCVRCGSLAEDVVLIRVPSLDLTHVEY